MKLTYSGDPQIFPDLGPDVVRAGDIVEVPEGLEDSFSSRPDFSDTVAGAQTAPEIIAGIEDATDAELEEYAVDHRVTVARAAKVEQAVRRANLTSAPQEPVVETPAEETPEPTVAPDADHQGDDVTEEASEPGTD